MRNEWGLENQPNSDSPCKGWLATAEMRRHKKTSKGISVALILADRTMWIRDGAGERENK